MNDAKLAHPDLQQLTAFAQGRLGEAELSAIHAHLRDCAECRDKVEASGDDTLVSLLRAADTSPNAQDKLNPPEAVTVAATASGERERPVALPADLAQHGRYRVQELLGVGGMGAVYKAEHLLMERPVALKLISHSLTSNPAMIERFRREVKAAGHLKHPNIVMAYDAEQAGDSHFLVMEYVEGKSLARVVADQGPLPVQQACEYVRQAAVGLQYAHERGMVHRDIKPQNLMLTPDGQVKILDFGLARFAMETAPAGALLAAAPTAAPAAAGCTATDSLTQVGIVMGTPDYIAPEQANDAHTADIRADIYSLGCTLYDLLAGHAPFAECTVMTKVMAHIERMPQPLSEVRKDVPPALAREVARMMAKDPAKRYQTPAEVATALARFAAPVAQARGRRLGVLAAVAVLLIGVAGYVYGATIYRIVTNQGELIVAVDEDKEIDVVLKAQGLTVKDRATNQEYRVSIGANDLKAGNYEMKVTSAAGLQLFTTQFTITRNGQTPVRITYQRNDAVAQAAKIAAAARAAEAWLKLKAAGGYAKAWEETIELGRKAIAQKDFIATYDGIAKKLGTVQSQTVQARPHYTTDLAGMPPGEYVIIEYKSSFEKWANTLERVTLMFEDGQWRIAGYFNYMQAIPPKQGDVDLVVRAGRGQLTKQEQAELDRLDPNLAEQLADPRRKTLVEMFANLPEAARKQLLKEGYLKWKFAALDPALQKTWRDIHQRALDEAKKLGAELPPALSLAALEKSDTGFALVNVPGLKESVVSWYVLFPAHPQPGIAIVVGPKPDDKQTQTFAEAHLIDVNALRTKPYSKSIEEFAKLDAAATSPRDEDRLQGITTNPRLNKTFENDSQIRALDFNHDGSSLIVAGNNLTFFDCSTGKSQDAVKLKEFVATPLSFSRDRNAVAFANQGSVAVVADGGAGLS